MSATGLRTTAGPTPAALAGLRPVHPIAWWVWAIGIAVATTRSPGPIASGSLIAAIVLVVALCHDSSPFARAFPTYLALAAAVVVVRVLFYILIGMKGGADVVIPLPRIQLPDWAGGIEPLGPVSTSGLVSAASAGLALAALLLCFGAAVALTNPQRTLRGLPASLHVLGTATVIAMTVTPQLVESWHRVRRAQSLRGRRLRGRHALAATTLPVLQDALERSLAIAASMDSRGYARVHQGRSAVVFGLMLAALIAAAAGTYALLDGGSPRWLAVALLVASVAAGVVGSTIASRRILTTRYRPDPWRTRENVVAGSGVAIAAFAVFGQAGISLAAAGTTLEGAGGWSEVFLLCAAVAIAPILVVTAR